MAVEPIEPKSNRNTTVIPTAQIGYRINPFLVVINVEHTL